jgi:ubiquinone/menaquinone biosynthesis C-methylase UbiE
MTDSLHTSGVFNRTVWRLYCLGRLALHPHLFFNKLYALDWYRKTLEDWLAWLQPPAASHLLELGCSTGGFSAALAQRGYRVTGVDRSRRAIRYARRHRQTAHLQFILGDALQLPAAIQVFHYTLAASLLNVVPEPEALLREMARVTTAGGIVSCLFPTPAMTRAQVAQYIARHRLTGFSAAALSLWADAATKLEPTTVMQHFRDAGLKDIQTTTLLQDMVGAVSGRIVPEASHHPS